LRITAAVFGQPFRWQIAAQSFFACPIEDEAGHCGELPTDLVVARFVGEQSLLACSGSSDSLAEKFAPLGRLSGVSSLID
jgi:hypothetical protein